MTPEEREATLERVTDIFLLSLETLAENFAAVVAGEKRIGFAERTIKKRKVWELRLTTPPPAIREPAEAPAAPKAFDPAELDALADSVGSTPPPAIPDDDPEFDSDVGDTCCEGGPILGHATDCPQGRIDQENASRKAMEDIMTPVPDWKNEALADETFDWPLADQARYRK